MKIRTGDKVRVISGKDKGKEGSVSRILIEDRKVVVEGVNIVTRHIKASPQREGGIVKLEKPIDISNVMLLDNDKPSRVGYKIVDGKKYRMVKKTGEIIKNKGK